MLNDILLAGPQLQDDLPTVSASFLAIGVADCAYKNQERFLDDASATTLSDFYAGINTTTIYKMLQSDPFYQ